jgi:hypothetical protein
VFTGSGPAAMATVLAFSPGPPSRWPPVEVVTVGVAIVTAAAAVAMLAAFRAGTRRQQRTGSLARRAQGRPAGLTRWVTGLYAEPLPGTRCPCGRAGQSSSVDTRPGWSA